MDPVTMFMAGSALVGMGMQIFGGSKQSQIAKQETANQQQQIQLEQAKNAQHYNQMLLTSKRENMQALRTSQQARATALNNATNQGAQFGSGLAGGIGQISGQTNTNLQSIGQNFQIGQNIFGLDAQTSALKMQMAGLQEKSGNDQAISSFGGSLVSNSQTFGKVGGQLFG